MANVVWKLQELDCFNVSHTSWAFLASAGCMYVHSVPFLGYMCGHSAHTCWLDVIMTISRAAGGEMKQRFTMTSQNVDNQPKTGILNIQNTCINRY